LKNITATNEEKMQNTYPVSIVLPAFNEALGLQKLLPELNKNFKNFEILVIDDGSTDNTVLVCQENNVKVISYPYSQGNGAAIKHGSRNASGDIIIFMDADGQHAVDDIPQLLAKLEEGYDMVVGARRAETHSSALKRFGNAFFNHFASLMAGHNIMDLTSGFRAVRKDVFSKFLYLMPNGFSYPTTSTMAFFRSGHPVAYIPISAGQRTRGTSSNIKVLKDGVRFMVIILKIGALFSPMRLFLPISLMLFLMGMGYYAYTYFSYSRFTNMSALLFISSLMVFLIGILSEQVASLHYKDSSH
jgi:glycosyltransferase involved in cell wall biosynthesis